MAAVGVDVRVEGTAELIAALAKMNTPATDKELRDAVAKGAAAMKPFVARAAPVGKLSTWNRGTPHVGGSKASLTQPGQLRASIVFKRGRRAYGPAAAVYARRSKGGWFSHFVIGGTKPHSLGDKTGFWAIRHPGASRTHPYMAEGGGAGTSASVAAVNKHITKWLDKNWA